MWDGYCVLGADGKGITPTETYGLSRTREEIEANGHLIAAAPELLEASQRLLNWVYNVEIHLAVAGLKVPVDEINRVNAAVKKATSNG
jgi:hypothetical protein